MLHVLQQHLVRNLQDDGLIRIGRHGVDRAGVDDEKFICPAAVTETHFQTAFQKINDLQIVVPVRRVAVAAVVDAVEKADADIPVCRNPFEIALHGALPFLVFSCIQTKRV